MNMVIIRKREIHELRDDDIRKRLADLKLDLAKDRSQISIGGIPKNTGIVKERSRTIARLLTELKERKKKKEVTNVNL